MEYVLCIVADAGGLFLYFEEEVVFVIRVGGVVFVRDDAQREREIIDED